MKFKNIVLGIGIVVVFALVLWQGVEAFYSSPEWEDYCGEVQRSLPIDSLEQCEADGGKWNAYDGVKPRPVEGEQEVTGWCDREFTCRQEYDNARDAHSKVVFVVSLIVAIIVFILGFSLLSVEPVGSALLGSGIWAIFWGSVINWRNFSSIWRFSLLLLALVLLIWLALKLNKIEKKKKGLLRKIFGK
jgi:hypothetical protein